MNRNHPQATFDEPLVYEIRVKGYLSESWANWFDGLSMQAEADGVTVLTGTVVDQAALYGLLRKVRDTGLQLLSVTRIETRQAISNTGEKIMKAIVQTQYGSPDVLHLQEVAKPTPKDNEIRVKIHAASVTPADSAFRRGEPFIIKLMYGLSKPKFNIGGVEFAGVVDAVGNDVTQFKVGEAVFGTSPDTFGAYAEYVCVPEGKPLTHKPDSMRYEDAVGISDGATTALTFLRNVANVQPGQKVLINGASGAVGGYAVQIAKHMGAEVTGVCSNRNVELVKSLGADHVIDYTRDDFTKMGGQYDVIFDAVGKSAFGKCQRVLTKNGIYMTTVPTLGLVGAILRTSIGRKKAKFTTAGLKQSKASLDFLSGLFEAGAIRTIIDRCYSLEEIPDAHRYVDTERKRGNVVVKVV